MYFELVIITTQNKSGFKPYIIMDKNDNILFTGFYDGLKDNDGYINFLIKDIDVGFIKKSDYQFINYMTYPEYKKYMLRG